MAAWKLVALLDSSWRLLYCMSSEKLPMARRGRATPRQRSSILVRMFNPWLNLLKRLSFTIYLRPDTAIYTIGIIVLLEPG
tara:strand:- start:298 stop:540 length:243 start_codon:yes stop_codon:yes gene_type:complete